MDDTIEPPGPEINTTSERTTRVIGVAIALGFPILIVLSAAGQQENLGNLGQDLRVVSIEWLATITVYVLMRRGERRGLGSLGNWKLRPIDLPTGLAALVAIFVAGAVVTHFFPPPFNAQTMTALPPLFALAFAVTAGFCEEFCFRGYALTRLIALTRSPWLASAIVIVAFGATHIARYGLSLTLLLPTTIGAILTLLYLWRGNIALCMIVHGLTDAISLLSLGRVHG